MLSKVTRVPAPPGLPGPQAAYQIAEPCDLDLDQIAYFAASVFWRSHVSTELNDYSLGERHAESLRRYLLLGILLVSSVVVVAVNLAVDLVYGLLDPRIVHR